MEATTPLIYETIARVMTKINAISKGRRNAQQGFAFRGIDDVMNELHPVMAECGLFVVPTVMDEQRSQGTTRGGGTMFYTRLKIKFTFYAGDGSSVESVVIGEAMDTGDKASNKALSIGLKYALLQVFCIPTEDEKDPDAESHNFQQEGKQPARQAPAKKAPAKAPAAQQPGPAGGPDTDAQRKKINALLGTKTPDGKPMFTPADCQKFSGLRVDITAEDLIEIIKTEIENRTPKAPAAPASNEAEAQPGFYDMKPASQLTPAEEAGAFEIF